MPQVAPFFPRIAQRDVTVATDVEMCLLEEKEQTLFYKEAGMTISPMVQ